MTHATRSVYRTCCIALCLWCWFIPMDVGAEHKKSSSSVTPAAPRRANAGWEYKRLDRERHFGSTVFSRAPLESEDAHKVFLYRNGKLYEDKKWRTTQGEETAYDIDFGSASRRKGAEERIWNLLEEIGTRKFLQKNVSHFVTYRDITSENLAQVWRDFSLQEPSWFVGVNANAADFKDPAWLREMTITLLHEYGHLLTLNQKQVEYRTNARTTRAYVPRFCQGGYQNNFGCAVRDSYLAAYTNAFWGKEEMAMLIEAQDAESKEAARAIVTSFYKKHKDQFVVPYAATNPEEDIAESFTDFILLQKPKSATKRKDAKILFFYNYPELVKERERIRTAIAPYIL